MTADRKTRVNNNIKSIKVLLIDENGTNLGEIPTSNALRKARSSGLDLVEVSPRKGAPVCRIMDYGKWKYDQKKKTKKNFNKKRPLKEIKFRPNTSDNDIKYRVKHAVKFLTDGHKVKLIVRFKGREMEHMFETGKAILERVLEFMDGEKFVLDSEAVVEGKSISIRLAPEDK